jgi:hypothetical protein
VPLVSALAGAPQSYGQAEKEKPLPVLDEFLQEVKVRLRSDRSLLNSYVYTEK